MSNKYFKKYWPLTKKNELTTNILTLLKSGAFAQILPILCMPLLTRIYTPNEFGIFILYTSIVLSLIPIAGLRYDYGIILPKKHQTAWHLMALTIKIIFIFSIICLVFFSSFKNEISHLLGNADLAIWLPLIGINILILGITQSITFWFNRHKQYSTIANQRMLQSISTNGSQITLGLGLNFGVSGLILGNLIGQAIALIYSIRKLTPQKIQKKYPMLNRKLLSHFKNLPLYNAPTALIDALRLNGINILLSIFFTVSVLGQFALAWRILQGPISLINGALSQVYYQHFTQLKQDDLHRFLLSCIKKSFLIGIVPFVLLFLLSEWLFTTFFGSSWQLAGQICSVLTPWLFFNFITSPISSIYVVLKQERVLLIFSIFYMLVPLSIIFLFNDNIIKTLTLVSISMSFLLCIFTYMALKLTKK